MLLTQQITLQNTPSLETPIGLQIDLILEQTEGDGPLLIKLHYMLNTLKFREWLQEHKYICAGPLSFDTQGLRVLVPKGADAWDKAGFSFNDQDGQPIFLPLLSREAIFHVHREIINKKEWIITYITPTIAAQNSSNEG